MFFPSPLREKVAEGRMRGDNACTFLPYSEGSRLLMSGQQRSYIHSFPLTLTLSLKGEGI